MYEKPDRFPYKGVDLRLTSPIYVMVSCMVITSASGHQAPDTIEHHRWWAPPPTSRDRMWYNWLWRVMQLLSRVCWKKVIFLLRIMLLYGAASLHWATTCWDPEGSKNRIKNSKSNLYRPFSGCARNGMCCHVAESICIKYIMFITVAKSTKSSTIIN